MGGEEKREFFGSDKLNPDRFFSKAGYIGNKFEVELLPRAWRDGEKKR